MIDKDDRIKPVQPVGNQRVAPSSPYGYERRQPERNTTTKKRKSAEPEPEAEPSQTCIITPEKVDCKI